MDLGRFSFDRDLTLAILLFNGDGTVYGRFGTKSSEDGMKHISIEGLKASLRAGLQLHESYPANRDSLLEKSGVKPKWGTQEKLPVKPLVSHGGCVHCHNVGSAEVLSLRATGEPVLDRHIWPYPVPDMIGLSVNRDDQKTISAIAPGSVAEKAGFEPGDQIQEVVGQPVISIADVQWCLQNAPKSGPLSFQVRRNGRSVPLTIPLDKGWRRGNDATWRITWDLLGTVAGFLCEPLPTKSRAKNGLSEDALALRLNVTQSENQYIRFGNPAARHVFRKGDVIVGIDGRENPMSVREFLAYLLQDKEPGEVVALSLLRNGKRVTVKLAIP